MPITEEGRLFIILNNLKRLQIVSSLIFILGLVYFSLLSTSGILVRMEMKEKLESLKIEIEKIEAENQTLEAKRKLLKNEKFAVQMEARKHYLLSKNSNILKFKEAANKKSEDFLLASRENLPSLKNKSSKNHIPPIYIFRFFFVVCAVSLSIGVFIKLK